MKENKYKVWCEYKNEWESHTFLDIDGKLWNYNGRCMVELRQETHKIAWFTGKKDENNIEIYSGDIVSRIGHDTANFASPTNKKEFISYVEWDYDEWYVGIGNFHYFNPVGKLTDRASKQIKVVGNIYENPDIFKYLKAERGINEAE